jgi:hypothetical protein
VSGLGAALGRDRESKRKPPAESWAARRRGIEGKRGSEGSSPQETALGQQTTEQHQHGTAASAQPPQRTAIAAALAGTVQGSGNPLNGSNERTPEPRDWQYEMVSIEQDQQRSA